MVPLNAPTCVVCEAAMSPQRIPKGSPRSPVSDHASSIYPAVVCYCYMDGKSFARLQPNCEDIRNNGFKHFKNFAKLTTAMFFFAFQEKLVCEICDTVNPADMTRCIACESQLPLKSKVKNILFLTCLLYKPS